MRLFTIVPVTVLALSLAVGVAAIVSEGRSAAANGRAAAELPSGMDILNGYACGAGETKKIIIRGVEDGFSPAGEEPGTVREGRNSSLPTRRHGAGQYDQVNMNRYLLDSFWIAGSYSHGLFLFRARALGDNGNDSVSLGDFTVDEASGRLGARDGVMLGEIEDHPAWRTSGDVHYAAIADISIKRNYPNPEPALASNSKPAYSLLSFLNDLEGSGWVDIAVQDDTAVDFMGLALCSPPAVRRGVSLTANRPSNLEIPGVVTLSCNPGSRDYACDPYVGDTPCSAVLPVACLKPGDAPAPVTANGRLALSTWSGGTIAVTEPVAGTRFRTVREVDGLCARSFGSGWRVAAIHDGNRHQSVSGHGDRRTMTGRLWVDIADQPHATCWARE